MVVEWDGSHLFGAFEELGELFPHRGVQLSKVAAGIPVNKST